MSAGVVLTVIGALLVLGLLADWMAARLPIPRVSALILIGVLAGPVGFDALPEGRDEWFPVVSALALVMVGFLIGGDFTRDQLRILGRQAGAIAAGQALVCAVIVGGGLVLLGVDGRIALPLAGVAAASAPAAIAGVVAQADERSGFGRLLLAVAALADALSLVLFSVLVVAVGVLHGTGGVAGTVQSALWELGGAIVLGVVLGVLGASLTGRLQAGRPILEEALGLVLVCAGISLWLDLSYLLAALVMGAVVANLATHHERAFRQIEGIEWPFLVVFFVLAGASLELGALAEVGVAAVGYIVLRIVGKVAGAWLGARMGGLSADAARWTGPALLPQAGVALGMAILAEEQFPEVGSAIVAVIVASTVVFELGGPALTRLAVNRVQS